MQEKKGIRGLGTTQCIKTRYLCESSSFTLTIKPSHFKKTPSAEAKWYVLCTRMDVQLKKDSCE